VVITLSNKKQKIEFDNNIDGAVLLVLERPDLVSDLRVLFNNKLSFTVLQATSTLLQTNPGRPMAILLGIPEISLVRV
jgi:hypothetical protein